MPSHTAEIETVWRQLRARRHQPPGRAGKGDRRRVFGSALEQSEQLFRAAGSVGYASQPILLFYALSQAGRAIAAASVTSDNSGYKLSGHGLAVPDLPQRPPLHRLTLIDQGKGSFTQLAAVLGSGSLPRGTTLGQIWLTIPDLLDWPLHHRENEYKKPLRLTDVRPRPTPAGERMVGWVIGLPTRWVIDIPMSEAEIVSYLSAYPTLGTTEDPGPEWAPITEPFASTAEETNAVWRAWPEPTVRSGPYLIRTLTEPYLADDDRWAFPALGGSGRPLHPVLAWWAVLFALSMLARYEPASWIQHLDVDASPDAVPLETALDHALNACPRLVMRAIHDVSSDTSFK